MNKIFLPRLLLIVSLVALLPVAHKVSADAYSGPGCEFSTNENSGEPQSPTCKKVDVSFVLTATDNALNEVYLVEDLFEALPENPSMYLHTVKIQADDKNVREKIKNSLSDIQWGNPPLPNEINQMRQGKWGFAQSQEAYLIPKKWYQAYLAPNTQLKDKGIWEQEFGYYRSDRGDAEPKNYYWVGSNPIISFTDFDAKKIRLVWNPEDVNVSWYRRNNEEMLGIPEESREIVGYVPVINPLKRIDVVQRLGLTDDHRLVLRLWKQIDYFEDGTSREILYNTIADLPQGATLKYFDLNYPETNIKADEETTPLDTNTPVKKENNIESGDPAIIPDESVVTERSWWRQIVDFFFGWMS